MKQPEPPEQPVFPHHLPPSHISAPDPQGMKKPLMKMVKSLWKGRVSDPFHRKTPVRRWKERKKYY